MVLEVVPNAVSTRQRCRASTADARTHYWTDPTMWPLGDLQSRTTRVMLAIPVSTLTASSPVLRCGGGGVLCACQDRIRALRVKHESSLSVRADSAMHHEHAGAFQARLASLQKHTMLDAVRSGLA